MNNYTIATSSFGGTNTKKDSDKNSFKESMTGIEKYWNDLNLDLEKKKKRFRRFRKNG